MSRAIADTSVFIAEEAGRPLGQLPEEIAVSVVTAAELELGVLRASDARTRAERLRTLGIYFDCGAQDRYGFAAGTTALDKLLTTRGIPHEAHIYPGGHDWQFVMDHFAAALTVVAKDIGAR